MALIIETRSRADTTSPWSEWSNLPVDAVTNGTFTDTDTQEYRVSPESNAIDVSDLTDGQIETVNGISVWTGTGVFDVLMGAINNNIKIQFDAGRIRGSDYATVYLGAMQSAIQQAMAYVLQSPIAEQQRLKIGKEQELLDRQRAGFDDDANIKVLKQLMDSWSVAYSVDPVANFLPSAITTTGTGNINDFITQIKSRLNL